MSFPGVNAFVIGILRKLRVNALGLPLVPLHEGPGPSSRCRPDVGLVTRAYEVQRSAGQIVVLLIRIAVVVIPRFYLFREVCSNKRD